MGALSRWPGGRALPLAILSLALVYATVAAVVGMHSFLLRLEDLREARWNLEAIGNRFLPLAAATLLFLLVGGAALAHPYENRSTPFRAFALLGLLGGSAWMAYGRHLALAFYAASSGRWFPGPPEVDWWRYTAALCAPFWLFAVTEDEALPLRAKARVPRRPLLALLAAPFLPGGGRGMLWTTLLVAVAILGAPGSFDRSDNEAVLDAWAYAMLFAGLLRFGRHRWMPAGSRGTTLARLAAPVLVLILSMLPFVVDLLIGDRRSSGNALHALSPVHLLWSGRHGDEFSGAVAGAAVLCFLCQIPAIYLGIEEVMKASRARAVVRPDVVAACAPWRLAWPDRAAAGRAGDRLGRGTGASLEFVDFRDYTPGDDLRHVDWRAYARTDALQVRLFREEVAPHVDLIVDGSASMASTPAKAAALRDLASCLVAPRRTVRRADEGPRGGRRRARRPRGPHPGGARPRRAAAAPAAAAAQRPRRPLRLPRARRPGAPPPVARRRRRPRRRDPAPRPLGGRSHGRRARDARRRRGRGPPRPRPRRRHARPLPHRGSAA